MNEFLGQQDTSGAITAWPLRYATGALLPLFKRPTVTRVNIGAHYFYCLPTGVARVTSERHAQLEALIPAGEPVAFEDDDAF